MQDPKGMAMVMTTVASMQEAESMAGELVDQSLAACVQIDGPVTSLYRWAGKVEKASEFRLMIKTSRHACVALCEKLASIHPYEEPEIIVFAVDESSKGYLDWVIEQTT